MITDVPSDDPGVVAKEVWIDAPPASVYGYFTDAGRLLQWMGVTATVEPVPGGLFRFAASTEDVMSGRFVELVPARRLVFTWGWEGGRHLPPGSSRVEITLAAERGGTRLGLYHRGLVPEVRGKHGAGWQHYLARLVARAQGQDPGPDPWASPQAAA